MGRTRLVLACAATALVAGPAAAGTLVLKKAFIEEFQNRVTMDLHLTVDHAKDSPNRIKRSGDDGDLHVAGRSPGTVGLPMVAEIVNARLALPAAAADLQALAGTGDSVTVSGVWRVWFEHPPANEAQVQGAAVPAAHGTNPDHMFEVHPLTAVGGTSLAETFGPIPGYEAFDAENAFGHYEKLTMTVQASNSGVQINANRATRNYADFEMELLTDAVPSDDGGAFVLADVLDEEGRSVVSGPRRMAFAPGTAPATTVAGLEPGDRIRVLGIPRMNLERLSGLLAEHGTDQFTESLPYEMIIVGVVED